tara:strand:- start:81 stop:599 length:519 start_codon:yes stop_codon:yes gene_type:complete
VFNINDINSGYLDHATGFASYLVKYEAIVFRPFRGEVLDAVVKTVTEVKKKRQGYTGVESVEKIDIFRDVWVMGEYQWKRNREIDFSSCASQRGFFAEAGPLYIFVAKECIPDSMEYDAGSTPPSWVSKNPQEQYFLTVDTAVRVKIFGVRLESTEIFAVGTIQGDYLGVLG